MSEKPKPVAKRKKRKNVNLSVKKRWKDILKDVDKQQLPIHVLEQIEVLLIDGTSVFIDIKKLLSEGQDPLSIEAMLDEKFEDLHDFIASVDFFIDIEKVADTIQPHTNKVLKDL